MDEREQLKINLIKALNDLSYHVLKTEGQIPDGFELHYGNDHVRVKAEIDINYEITSDGFDRAKEILNKAFTVMIHPEDLKKDE